ncbi:MAG: DNA polymerase IV [bacterium]
MKKVKVIYHIDLNQFFCAVAILLNPSLKGKAFAIGRENSTKGVVSTASYEARKYNIKAGMPLIDCYRNLKSLIVVNPDYSIYEKYSNLFFDILSQYSSNIVKISIDEGYLDVTNETLNNNIHPVEYAQIIQNRIKNEIGLECSIGIAPTLFLAKMASDLKKPMGITVLRKRDCIKVLGGLKVDEIYGVGKKTSEKLHFLNINTINDFLNEENKYLITKIMSEEIYDSFIEKLKGNSSNIVEQRAFKTKSISHSQTYDYPLDNFEDILEQLFLQAKELVNQLEMLNYRTKTITITLRDVSFKTITRSVTIDFTDEFNIINTEIENLLEMNYKNQRFRLVGVTLGNLKTLEESIKITLFNVYDVYK